jgi:hypothetical protein
MIRKVSLWFFFLKRSKMIEIKENQELKVDNLLSYREKINLWKLVKISYKFCYKPDLL